MIIQVNSDDHITNTGEFIKKVSSEAEDTLKRFKNHISRLEIHFADENKGKKGVEDKKCTIELRLNSHHPEAVSYKADTLDTAFKGAIDKAKHLVITKVDQMKEHRN